MSIAESRLTGNSYSEYSEVDFSSIAQPQKGTNALSAGIDTSVVLSDIKANDIGG